MKRTFDLLLGSFFLILFSPLLAGIALAIKMTSPGPIFYGSPRVGKRGKPITCWKFRTMCIDADKKLEAILKKNPTLKEEWETYFKLKDDPRVTRIGRWLRHTSFDELPQLWNVLGGDLSLVGPRPFLAREIQEAVGQRADKILSVRPGITGIWQTSGRNLLTFEQRIELDASYVDRQSLWLDLQLICKTLPTILFRRGAY